MGEIRLIATDLDGTFLARDRKPTEATLLAVRGARAAGVHVCACTGRNHTEVKALCETAGLSDLCVINNGAAVCNWRTGEMPVARRFDPDKVKSLIELLLCDAKAHGGATVSTAGGYDTHQWRGSSDESMLRRAQFSGGMGGFNAELYYIHEEKNAWIDAARADTQRILYGLDTDLHGERVRTLLAPVHDVLITTAAQGRMEIAPPKTGKGDGLRRLCALYRVDIQDVMAIGDGLNDADMIEAAGFGVAMGNAMEAVLLVADAVTESNEDDGFANAVYRYVLKRA
jgi:hypothetical protein